MQSDQVIITTSSQETMQAGKMLAQRVRTQNTELNDQKREQKGATVVCLYGELGSGKTTFVQGFAKGLGITSRLLSPTFIIVRRYQIPDTSDFLYHLDLYRIGGAKDLQSLGIAEILTETGSYVLIEWAEKLEGQLPQRRIEVWFKTLDDGRHTWTLFKKP